MKTFLSLGMVPDQVLVVDNLSTGKKEWLDPRVRLIPKDIATAELDKILLGVDIVWHLAAEPDVRIGAKNTFVHLEKNILITHRLLDAMRTANVKKIVFTSTSAVYGEARVMPTPEDHSTHPISLYGASKLACEALIMAYCHTFDMQAWIYRLANVVGPRATHGVIPDLIQKLRGNPNELEILGDGKQRKSYIYIEDTIEAMLTGLKSQERVNIFNVGTKQQTTVDRIAQIICGEMKLKPRIRYTGSRRGWPGDVPEMLLSTKKLERLGWKARQSSEQAIRRTVKELLTHSNVDLMADWYNF